MGEGTPYRKPSNEEMEDSARILREEIYELADGSISPLKLTADAKEEYDNASEADQERFRLSVMVSRIALLVSFLNPDDPISPSIWLGQMAGFLMESEMLTIGQVVRNHAEQN